MKEEVKQELKAHLAAVYGAETAGRIIETIRDRYEGSRVKSPAGKSLGRSQPWVDESEIIAITYGDSVKKKGQNHLRTLKEFMDCKVGDAISTIHILPMFPYSSDDGFSVTDYRKVDERLGDWTDLKALSGNYSFMFDAVINHISRESRWFQGFVNGEAPYADYFITADPKGDYSKVTRPRALPLLTAFETKLGTKHVWTTFSEDQIDLNYENPQVLLEILDVLLLYANEGARFIRLDAIGFLWKEKGTTCMHLPQTHEIIKVMKLVLEEYAGGTILITETNVPHKENISYFGDGYNEAGLVYQFPLPPLVLFSFLTGNAEKLSRWAESLELPSDRTTYFNFLASHDGIGMRPTEGILTREEQDILADAVLKHGGRISYKDNGDGTKSPYELNINYQDALSGSEDSDQIRIERFLAAQTILLSMQGVPGIYIHSLLGSRNDYYGVETSGINRRINREKLEFDQLDKELTEDTNRRKIFEEFLRRIRIRKEQSAFSPAASQKVLYLGAQIFALLREHKETGQQIYVLVNVSTDRTALRLPVKKGLDLINQEKVSEEVLLQPLMARWIVVQEQ